MVRLRRRIGARSAPSDGAVVDDAGYSAVGSSVAVARGARGSGSTSTPPSTSNQKPPRFGISAAVGDAGAGRDQAQDAAVGHDQRRACPRATTARDRGVEPGEHRRRRPRRPAARRARPGATARACPATSRRSRRGVTLPTRRRCARGSPDAGDAGARARAAMISAVRAGPAEVGAVDDRGAKPSSASAAARSRGLRLAERGERRVEPALPAVLEVPLRLAVADDQEVAHGWAVNAETPPAGLTLGPARRQT